MNDERIMQEVENALVKRIKDGDIITSNYNDRIDINPLVKQAYQKIDKDRLMLKLTEGLEEMIATKLINKIVTEMGTDIKNLMSNNSVRDDFKFFLRSGVQKVLDAVKENSNEKD